MASLTLQELAVVALTIALYAGRVYCSSEQVKGVALGFGAASYQCGKEVGLSDEHMDEIYNFWNEDFEMKSRLVGCAIICMSKKHGIVKDDGRLHHENGAEFAKKHGADDEVARTLVKLIHGCEEEVAAIADDCDRVLEVAKCFKRECTKLKWMPDFRELVGGFVDAEKP